MKINISINDVTKTVLKDVPEGRLVRFEGHNGYVYGLTSYGIRFVAFDGRTWSGIPDFIVEVLPLGTVVTLTQE